MLLLWIFHTSALTTLVFLSGFSSLEITECSLRKAGTIVTFLTYLAVCNHIRASQQQTHHSIAERVTRVIRAPPAKGVTGVTGIPLSARWHSTVSALASRCHHMKLVEDTAGGLALQATHSRLFQEQPPLLSLMPACYFLKDDIAK